MISHYCRKVNATGDVICSDTLSMCSARSMHMCILKIGKDRQCSLHTSSNQIKGYYSAVLKLNSRTNSQQVKALIHEQPWKGRLRQQTKVGQT